MNDFYIVSPAGKISAVASEEQCNNWLRQGFRMATEEEIAQFTVIKTRIAKATTEEQTGPGDVYMATVSIGGKDGYGTAAKHIMDGLQDAGISISPFQKNQKIGFLFHSPQALVKLENPFRIIYTMFESDKIPDTWIEYLQEADKVLVPSHWCMEVFAKAGIAADVVPLGFDETIFTYQERSNKREERKDFIFLHYNAFNARKGFLELWKAFNKAFDPMEPVKLVLKTTVKDWPHRFPYISEVRNPNVRVIDETMDANGLVQLLGEADCFVFPSRGEGFGLTPLEAMATGLPVIVPNAHGISEYFNAECMYEAPVARMSPALYSRYKGMDVGNMVECDVDKLASQMRYVYEHQEEALEKGRKAAEYAKNFTYRQTARQLQAVFSDFLGREPIDRPVRNILPLEEVI